MEAPYSNPLLDTTDADYFRGVVRAKVDELADANMKIDALKQEVEELQEQLTDSYDEAETMINLALNDPCRLLQYINDNDIGEVTFSHYDKTLGKRVRREDACCDNTTDMDMDHPF